MRVTLTILGCGTSTGVPIPGCKCKVCTSPNPKDNRLRTSALIRADEGTNILIDTSPDLRQQALKFGISHINAVLYTHSHADHILGIEDLRAFNFIQRSAIPLFATSPTIEEIKRSFSYIFIPNPTYEGGLLAQLSVHEFEELESFSCGAVVIQPFPMLHGRMKVSGFRIGTIGYATDCNFIPEESKAILKGVKHLVLDGLRYEPHNTHFTIPEAIKVASELEVEDTILTHMTHAVDYDEVSELLPANVRLAYDGLIIEGHL